MKAIRNTLIVLSPGFPENEADTTCLPAQQALINSLNANFKSLNIIVLSFQYPFISVPYRCGMVTALFPLMAETEEGCTG